MEGQRRDEMGMIVVSRSKQWLRWCCAGSVILCTVGKELAWLLAKCRMRAFEETKVTYSATGCALERAVKREQERSQRTGIRGGRGEKKKYKYQDSAELQERKGRRRRASSLVSSSFSGNSIVS